MRFYTAYLRPQAAPRLVPEGFSIGAFLFGPLWLAAHAAWVPAALVLAVDVGLGFVPAPWRGWLELASAVIVGLHGHDLRRWALELRGWLLTAVVAGRDEDAAYARLLAVRPELVASAGRG